MKTAEARYYTEGHPGIIPEKPSLHSQDIEIVKNERGRVGMVLQRPPYDNVESLTYDPDELRAMGLVDLEIPHTLVAIERGTAWLMPEQREGGRTARLAAAQIGVDLDPKELETQNDQEFRGARDRFEGHFAELVKAVQEGYRKKMAKRLTQGKFGSPRVTEISEAARGEILKEIGGIFHQIDTSLARAVTPESIKALTDAALENSRQDALDDFHKPENIAWEDCISELDNSNSDEGLGAKRFFDCDDAVAQRLSALGKAAKLQLDENPLHTVTIMTEKGHFHLGKIKFTFIHPSGEKFSERASKRQPPSRGSSMHR